MGTEWYKWLLIAAILAFALPAGAGKAHPFYISVTEINYNADTKGLEISCKVFTNDLETALTKANGKKPDLYADKDKVMADKQIAAYINDHLSIKINGRQVALAYLGFERENEAVWSYLESRNMPLPKNLEIVNSLLYDSFEQQINLVHVTVKGERKSAKLTHPDTALQLKF